MIETNSLTKRFGEKTAVDRLTLSIPRGQVFAFLGPNGAGKTTTIKLLIGLLRPTEGTVSIGGHDISQNNLAAKAMIGYVPDEPYLYEKLTGREFLTFVGRMYRMPRRELRDEIRWVTELFELEEFLDELCETYSHGMRQRMVFSAALLHRPSVLIIDEPMVGLDPKSARIVKNMLREHASNGGVVFLSTHTLSVAEEIADRIGIINHGRLIAEGTRDELMPEKDQRLETVFLQLTEEEEHGGPGDPNGVAGDGDSQ